MSGTFRKFLAKHRRAKSELEHSTPHYGNIDPEEKHFSLKRYTRSGHHSVNKVMRKDPDYEGYKHDENHIRNLKRLAKAHKSETPMVLHRGISHEEGETIEPGKTHHYHSFISTSTSPSKAKYFADNLNSSHNLRIKVPAGTHYIHPGRHSYHPDEREVILPPGKIHITHTKVSGGRIVHHGRYEPDHLHDVDESTLLESFLSWGRKNKEKEPAKPFEHGSSTKEGMTYRQFLERHRRHKEKLDNSTPHIPSEKHGYALRSYVGGSSPLNRLLRKKRVQGTSWHPIARGG